LLIQWKGSDINARHFSSVQYFAQRPHETLISCCGSIISALFRTIRILSSCPRRASILRLNSSEMWSLWASKSKIMRSTRSANHWRTALKSYPRSTLCFSPDRIPGVSTIVSFWSRGEFTWEHCKRLRNAFLNFFQRTELFGRVHNQSIVRNYTFGWVVRHSHETIGRRFGSYSDARKLSFQ
jgi:transposase